MTGLGALMEELAKAYQAERPDPEVGDLTALGIRELVRCALSAVFPASAVNREIPRVFTLVASSITRACKELVGELELDFDTEHVSVRRVGRVLGRMRRRAERTAKAKGRTISSPELQRWTVANGFAWPDELTPA